MSITVTVTLSVELSGDDVSTGEPNTPIPALVLQNSPAQRWPYQIQGGLTAGGPGMADNYLQIPVDLPASLLFIDPGVTGSGATFVIKGVSGDVGIAISSALPSLLPVALGNPVGSSFSSPASGTTLLLAPQWSIDLASSLTTQTPMGWF